MKTNPTAVIFDCHETLVELSTSVRQRFFDDIARGVARSCSRARPFAPGEVLVSDTVRGLARTSAGVTFDDRGERDLKGVSEPVRLFAVREGTRG